jgi:MerR family mercuric resistance operon transcriptional regulator
MDGLKIGQLAKLAHVNIDTVRYYEQRGLMPEPPRSESGYRLYADEDAKRLRFIKRAQELGFSLKEILDLLTLRVDSRTTCRDVKQRVDAKVVAVDEKIEELQAFRRALTRLSVACDGDAVPAEECPILGALDAEGELEDIRA